jgi:hypothetical protein
MTGRLPRSQKSSRISARDLAQAKAAADKVWLLDPAALTAADIETLRSEILLHRAARKQRVRCGARTRRGTACAALSEPGRQRCRFHGGQSTGPRTPEGRRRVSEAARARMIARWAARKKEKRDEQPGG